MKDFTTLKDFKTLAFIEVLLLVMIGFVSLDFLPRNFNEFKRICTNMWSLDPKQYEICMQPYFRETSLDKYLIGVAIIALIAVPILFKFLQKRTK